MNNQDQQSPSSTTEKPVVNKKRRLILGAGAIAPIVLTLVSPSVLGNPAGCLSQQMSGNTSQQGAGSCNTGLSPTNWSNSSLNPWPPGFIHHVNGSDCGSYSGGIRFNATNAFIGDSTATEMAAILCASVTSSEAHFVAAMLNAQVSGYILTPVQVRDLRNGGAFPPGYANVEAFLASTWL
jgi:hypothetical protein